MDITKGIASKKPDGIIEIVVNRDVYGLEAVRAASYGITSKYHVSIMLIPENKVSICLESKHREIKPGEEDEEIKEFIDSLIDHQVRQDLIKEFGEIRNSIVKEAFRPVEKKKK